MFSLDNIEEINYFLRYPADWDKILETINISEQYSKNVETFVLCSLILMLVRKNSIERIAKFKINSKTVSLAGISFILGILSLNKVSEFIYFNF